MATYASQIGTTISKRMSDEPSFKEAYAEHRAKWLKGEAPPTFTWNDKKYSVATREEAARQKEMMESPMRGRGYGQRSESRAEIPTGGAAQAPAARPRASLSDIPGLLARGMAEGAERVPPGRGLGAAFVGAGAGTAARAVMTGAKAARNWRDNPPAGADLGKWQAIVRQIDEAYPGGASPSGGISKEALAKELAQDIGSGSVGRGTPMRSTATTAETGRRFTPEQEVEAATSAMRGAVGRRQVQEARTGRSQAAAEAKAEKPILRTEKGKETPRSRTRDEEDIEFRKGGKVKTYASGGSVKGSGCERRGLRKCKVY